MRVLPRDRQAFFRRISLKWPATALLIGILITIVFLFFFGSSQTYENSELSGILNIIFISLIYLVMAWITARSFVSSSQLFLIFMGTAQLLIGVASSVGPLVLQSISPNASVTVHNTSALIAGLLIICSVIFAWRAKPGKIPRIPKLVLVAVIYVAALILIAFLAWAALSGTTPAFVLPNGFSILRQIILSLSACLFIIAAIIYGIMSRQSKSDFIFWYSLGLASFSIGIFGVMLQPSVGSVLSWTGRGAQFLSGVYFLAAAFFIMREARTKGVEIPALIADFGKRSRVNYQLLVNAASDAIIAVDGKGRILVWNPAAEKIFGY